MLHRCSSITQKFQFAQYILHEVLQLRNPSTQLSYSYDKPISPVHIQDSLGE